MAPEKSQTDVLTPAEVAAVFRVGPEAVRQWADNGKLISFRTPGGQRRFRRADVEAFLLTALEPSDGEAIDRAVGE